MILHRKVTWDTTVVFPFVSVFMCYYNCYRRIRAHFEKSLWVSRLHFISWSPSFLLLISITILLHVLFKFLAKKERTFQSLLFRRREKRFNLRWSLHSMRDPETLSLSLHSPEPFIHRERVFMSFSPGFLLFLVVWIHFCCIYCIIWSLLNCSSSLFSRKKFMHILRLCISVSLTVSLASPW